MICSQCQTENEVNRKFCMECGARLATGCPNCGAQNSDAAKFCGECGTALEGASPSRGPVGEDRVTPGPTGAAERRLVTVLFADLVGFTTLAEGLDPEDTREFLTRYFELARTIVERYGGTIEKFIGDAVMAVWGAPIAHEDDAERAVRAALDIVAGVPAIGDSFKVQVRAGLLTGEAAVTVGASGQGMVAGDLVNTASRLQSVAPPGSVLVGEATYRAASGAISFEPAGEQLLKGKELPVPAWRAAAVIALRRGSGRSEALEPPFTGRDEELRMLKDLFHATERDGKARLLSVVGQGGIGKSRLAWEFEKYIDGVVGDVWWHAGRSPAYGDGISYWALAEMVRSRAGIAETDEHPVARNLLREAVVEWVTDESDRRWIEPRLAALLALEPMPPGSRDELFAAWRAFFERIAERGPVVLVFEDVQWADDGMLDFIEEIPDRSRNLPILVVTLARPELFDRRPGWGTSLRSFSSMRLDPLEDEQIAHLVHGTVPGIPDQAVAAIVARAEGIPLYAVETVRMLLDRGELQPTGDGRYELTGRIDRLAVPETLHALIAARLDGLDEHERRILQTAAVVGQSFTLRAVSAVANVPIDELRERLTEIVRRQLLRVELDPRSPERGQYQFVQAVVKEVAEGSLSRADRRALHVAAARYYESLGDDELAGVLASHYVEAYRASPVGPEADALAAQARVSLRGAAERATSLHSHAQGLSYLEQALAVTDERTERAATHERAALSAEHLGRHAVAMEHAQAVERLYREIGDSLGALRGITRQASLHVDEHREMLSIELLRPALDEVAHLPSGPEVSDARAELARALMLNGAALEAVAMCDLVLTSHATVSNERLVDVLITKGTALATTTVLVEAEVLLRGAMEVADRLGLASAGLRALNNLLSVVQLTDLAEVQRLLDQGFATAQRFGMRGWAVQLSHTALSNAFEMGDWDAWVEETAALEPESFYRGWHLVELAVRSAFRGDSGLAHDRFAEARELAEADSSQAIAGFGQVAATIAVAEGDWEQVMPGARVGWGHYDSTIASVAWAVVAAVATGQHDWVDEAVIQLGPEWLGRYPDGVRAFGRTAVALIEERWSDARTGYSAGRQALSAIGAGLWVGMLDLAFSTRAAGKVPEAEEAGARAEAFFTSLGAEAFVERYRQAAKSIGTQSTARLAKSRVSPPPNLTRK